MIAKGTNGFSILLADVPNAGVAREDPNAKSGNAHHDTRSGKFGSSKPAPKKPAVPPNQDPAEYQRMMAAVRDAAREFDSFDEGDIREFLAGRAKDPDSVDIQRFIAAVRTQRVADFADMLDQQFRLTNSEMKSGRRKVTVRAPKNFIRKAVKDLTPEELEQVKSILASRGHDEAKVSEWLEQKSSVAKKKEEN